MQGADKSLARPDWKKKTIERSPFFVRRGDHCCRRDLVGRTNFWILFLSGLQKFRVWSLLLVSFNEELNDRYSSPNIVRVIKSRRMRWAGHVALMGQGRGVCRVLVGKPEWRRPLGRPRRRWEDTIRMDLREVGCGCVEWMELAEDRDRWHALVSAVMNLRVP